MIYFFSGIIPEKEIIIEKSLPIVPDREPYLKEAMERLAAFKVGKAGFTPKRSG